jgi:hypothetical protein
MSRVHVIVEVKIGREVLRYRPPLKQARKILGEMLFGLAPFTEHRRADCKQLKDPAIVLPISIVQVPHLALKVHHP